MSRLICWPALSTIWLLLPVQLALVSSRMPLYSTLALTSNVAYSRIYHMQPVAVICHSDEWLSAFRARIHHTALCKSVSEKYTAGTYLVACLQTIVTRGVLMFESIDGRWALSQRRSDP